MIQKLDVLKKKRNAIVLAHNYQPAEVQDIADFLGDSLELSRKAAETDADVIVFCGVHFMAETAYILSPQKTVLLPEVKAGCPMADMISAEQLRELKSENPEAAVVCYVNSTAEVKAESDICCTSANAVNVVKSLPQNQPVIFVPDQHLGDYVAQQLGRDLILWRGYCPTHARILETDIDEMRAKHPKAEVLAHPECPRPVRDAADAVLSTGAMRRYVQESETLEFIIATELGMVYRLQQDNPTKKFYAASSAGICPNMKKISVEKVVWSLEDMSGSIVVPEEIRKAAYSAIQRMLEIS